jgi:energy-coupling factor transport system ATP-binding protein
VSEPLIRARGLEHTYMAGTPLAVKALWGVDMEVWAGEAVGIIGPAAAGKSTLAQHLNGLLRPDSPGQLWIDGQDLGDPRVEVRPIRQRIGLVFQRPEDQLFRPLVGDDIAFGPQQLGLSRAEVRERVQWAMALVGLDFDAFVDRPTLSLSGGERRRAAIAGVLALRPSTLVLDEATSGLDPRGRRDLLRLLRHLHTSERATIILVTSHLDDLVGLAGRVYALAAGRTLLQGSLEEVFGQPELLRRHGLGVPQMAEIAEALAARGCHLSRPIGRASRPIGRATPIPLSLAEAEAQIAPRLEGGCGVL